MRVHTGLVAAMLAIVVPTGAKAQFTSTTTDCSDLQLYGATGVPNGATHGYRFRGVCREIGKSAEKSWVRWEGWVEIDSKFDQKTGTLIEQATVKVSGQYDGPPSGTVSLSLKCGQDPMLTTSSCTIMKSDAKTSWPDFVGAWKKGQPFTKGKVTLAQATTLSSQSASGNPPPPPPSTSKPIGSSVKTVSKLLDKSGSTSTENEKVTAQAASTPIAPKPLGTEVSMRADAKIALRDGRAVAAQLFEGSLRWMILGGDGVVLRTFPEGSRVFRAESGNILVDWGGGSYDAGREQPTRRLALPRRGNR